MIATSEGERPVTRVGRTFVAGGRPVAWVYYAAPEAAPAPGRAPRRPETLIRFLAERGGLRPCADLRAMDLHLSFVPGAGKLVRAAGSGQSLDAARSDAVEHGFLPEGADINDLLDALDADARGHRVTAAQDLGDEMAHVAHEDHWAAWMQAA